VSPLIVVVADNGGGGIFSFLPPATALDAPVFERIFGTPQASDVASVAAGFGWTVEEIDAQSGSSELADALERATGRGGGTVIRVGLPDRRANVDLHARVNAAIVAAVDDTAPA
jgi:2-succinyl-5-enolpyruvyl-6-hydroxy-3-cyclohexene-1-carboxylate synthase